MSTEVTPEMMDITIARFMGMEGTDDFILKNYHYHKSWELLMPVVEKIHNLAVAGDAINGITSKDIFTFSIFALLKDVHAAVYQFITWYNQQKQTNEH